MSNARDIADAGHQLKAWVYFHGNLDSTPPSGSTLTAGENTFIYQSFNVSSVLYTETGTYEIKFPAGLLSDTNYLVLHCLDNGMGNNLGAAAQIGKYGDSLSSIKTTGKVRIQYRYQGDNTAYDIIEGYVAIFR